MKLLACDLGGTRMKLGLIDRGQLLAQEVIPAHSHLGLGSRLPAIAAALRRIASSGGGQLGDCAGVAISFPSLIDVGRARIHPTYGKYQDATDIDLRAWSHRELGLPLAIENDARMALIGEWNHGAGRGCDDVVMITLGTGIGTAAVIRGEVLRGKHGQAGCLSGHLSVRYGGRACNCGNLGCAEAEASTAFLAKITTEQADFAASGLAHEPALDYEAVFRLAAAGDNCARTIRDHSILVWATLVVNLIVAYDPERVVIGGGIMASGDIILPALQQYVDRHAPTPWGRVEVVRAALGDSSALFGGEWLLRDQLPRFTA